MDFARQRRLPSFGEKGQAKLAAARVAIYGLGGLGCPAALYLARAGVGELHLIDPDVVETTNLHRQVLYDEDDVGHPKVEVAAAALRRAGARLVVDRTRFAAGAALPSVDVVLDCTDDVEARYALADACIGRVPLIQAGIAGAEGQITVFAPDGPCYRCLHPAPVLAPTCAEEGVLGTVCGILGTMQASEAVREILGRPGRLRHEILLVDALGGETTYVHRPRRPDCACRAPPSPGQSTRRTLLDVRSIEERTASPVPASLHIPLDQLPARLGELPDGRIDCICARGARSSRAASFLRSKGIDAHSVEGGLEALQNP